MCTVTYLPTEDHNFIFTSNRDETPNRKTVPPKEYIENGVKMVFPKDEKAGGTWIGLSEKKRLVCLLNGGHKNHVRKNNYRMSRGVIVKKMLSINNPVQFIESFNLAAIEPFTLILIDWSNTLLIYELVWDGVVKYFELLPNVPKIWSSSTLYTDEMKEMRKQWFTEWIAENSEFHQQKIIDFHTDDTKATPDIAVKMKRLFVETVSVTSVQKNENNISFTYVDFINKKDLFLVDIF